MQKKEYASDAENVPLYSLALMHYSKITLSYVSLVRVFIASGKGFVMTARR